MKFVSVIVPDAALLRSMLLLSILRFTETDLLVLPQLLQRRYLVVNIEPRTVQNTIAGPPQISQLAGIRIGERLLWNFWK